VPASIPLSAGNVQPLEVLVIASPDKSGLAMTEGKMYLAMTKEVARQIGLYDS